MTNLEEIKSRLGILDVITNYIRVEKAGSQYKARCPFHNERTPSFYISPERGTFHCFGCGEKGDIFGFVSKIEHLEFRDALRLLADRAGVKLTGSKSEDNSRIINILNISKNFFIANLSKSIEAKKYLHDRGLIDETIKEFEIGYSNNNWRDLFIHLKTAGFNEDEMVESGLVIRTDDNKYYDRFRGRVMFPINNSSGITIGFTGRIMPALDDGKSGKYVNTPETKVYHKGSVLFNYDKAKKYISEKKEIILAEGQMDVILSYQAGIKNIVAVSGTAFTEDQVKIITRLADKSVLAFDNDSAGKAASNRAALMCLYGGMEVEAVNLLSKDIADTVLENKEEWIKIYNSKNSFFNLLAEEANRINDVSAKLKMIKEQVIPLFKAINSPLLQDFRIRDFARVTDLDPNILKKEITQTLNQTEIKSEINEIKTSIDIKERILQEINFLSKSLSKEISDSYKIEIPDEIYEKLHIELEVKDAINIKYFDDIKRKLDDINYKEEHQRLTNLVKQGDIEAISMLQKLVNSRK